jgi:membrane fusion protein
MLKIAGSDSKDLFREEAIQSRRGRLIGETMIKSPLMSLPLTLALVAIVVSALGLTFVIPFSREYQAVGWIVPRAGLIEVQSPASGTVAAILVAEGGTVRAGERILVVATGAQLRRGGSVEDALIGTSRETASLLDARETTLSTAHRSSMASSDARLASLRRDRSQLAELLKLKREAALVKAAQLARYVQLLERGFGSGIEQQRRETELLFAKQEIIEAEVRLSTFDREIEELRGRLTQERSDYSIALNELQQQRRGVSSDVLQADARRGASIIAPASGRISRLAVRPGQPVAAGTTLLSIVPPGPLEVQLLAPAQVSGLPEPGARARILVEAFPFRRYGALSGYVKTVARSTALPDQASETVGVKVPYFVIVVALDSHQRGLISQVDVRPGMVVSGRIELERQSLLKWLLPQT